MSDLIPPHSPTNEESVIGAVLINPEIISEIDLEPEDFYIERNKFIWQSIRELRETGQDIDYVTVCTNLDKNGHLKSIGGPSRITEMIANCPQSMHAVSYARAIRSDFYRRRAVIIARSILTGAMDQGNNLSEIIPGFIDQLSRLAMIGASAVHWSKYLGEILEEVEYNAANPSDVFGIETGIIDFDNITGGLIPGEVMKLSGEPGVGKSMLAMQMVCHAASQGHPGAAFHLEMKGKATARRVVSAYSKVTTRAMKTGKLVDGDWPKIVGAINRAEQMPIYLSDYSEWTTAALRVELERLASMYKIEWVLIDYEALLCDDPDKEDNQRSKVISTRLHGIIKDLNLAGLVIDDMNKEGIKSGAEKGQASLAGSARKLYDADSIWIMRKKKSAPNIVQLCSEKLREGEGDSKRVVELLRINGIPEFQNVIQAKL